MGGLRDDLIVKLYAREMFKAALKPSYFAQFWTPTPPLTRWQRFKYRLWGYGERLKTAWRVLRGDDIHEDCC